MKVSSIKKLFKKINKIDLKHSIPKAKYVHYYHTLPIDSNMILCEASHGNNAGGNVFYLLKNLAIDPEYASYKIYFTCRESNKDSFRKLLDSHNMQRVELVEFSTDLYVRILASAKYLINDTTFMHFYMKKEGQVYLNTWHGTPLKTLGKKVNNDMHGLGNVQKNFLAADYLLYPNEYTKQHMIEDYMLENIAQGKTIVGGYPRNEIFFDEDSRFLIRKQIDCLDKKVYAYMPTWRGAVGKVDKDASNYLQNYLNEIDSLLLDEEILYVNIHTLAKKNIIFDDFKHIKQFPDEYETYEFLNIADCLITDYSSVFYDFAITHKKCILFTYDEEEYFEQRGLYRPLSSLPFPSVKNVKDLLDELRTPINYDDNDFLKEYCPYDNLNAAKILCDQVILNKSNNYLTVNDIKNNHKENILIFSGKLDKNGITTSLMNLLNHLDLNEKNYFITFNAKDVARNKDILQTLPNAVGYIPMAGAMNLTFFKKIIWKLYKDGIIKAAFAMRFLEDDFKNELKRCYVDVDYTTMIQFSGYGIKNILLYSVFAGNNVLYTHNDVYQEISVRGNLRADVLQYAYQKYDHIGIVSEDLIKPTSKYLTTKRELELVPNLIDVEGIKTRGSQDIIFDETTLCNHPLDQVMDILNGNGKKLVNVGRFSPEKGHRRLIDSFARVWKDNPDTYLFIIGGNEFKGLYGELCAYVDSLPCKEHIVMLLAMSNPLPIVKACDAFVFSSFYEGFGLVLVEADILGLPLISTDIVGPRTFMNEYGGVLVEDSEQGLEEGMRRLLANQIPRLGVDYDAYNQKAINCFKSVLKVNK